MVETLSTPEPASLKVVLNTATEDVASTPEAVSVMLELTVKLALA